MRFRNLKGEYLVNLNFNTSNLTGFAKTLVAVIGSLVALWQVPQVRDAITPILAAHPQIASILAAGLTIWATLHNPIKQGAK